MSTWAARLSTGSKSPESRCASSQGTPFLNPQATPSPPPPGAAGLDAFTLTASPTDGSNNADWKTAKQQAEEAEAKALREEFRQIAEWHNADRNEVPVLKLPFDLWEYVTCFLGYADVMRLSHSCRSLWGYLLRKDSVWEQQLRFFHEDILDMRGGSLLMTDFAIPTTNTSSVSGGDATQTGMLSAYHRFWREKRLYVLDAHREWHFKELSSLEDKDTGVFTVPLHLGHETLASSAVAPLSRPHDPLANTSTNAHIAAASPREATAATGNSFPFTPIGMDQSYHNGASPTTSATPTASMAAATASPTTDTPSPLPQPGATSGAASPTSSLTTAAAAAPPGSIPSTVRMPAVGSPFVGPHRGDLRLQIYRPVRPGEKAPSPNPQPRGGGGALVEGGEQRNEGCANHGEAVIEHEEEDEYGDSDAAAQSTELYFPTDQPTTVEDEEAALAYVLALSEAEAKGLPPPPPPMYRRTVPHGNVNRESHRRGGTSNGSFFSSSRGGGGGRSSSLSQPFLTPSELLTIAEMINQGTVERSRIPIRDVTHTEPQLFLLALEETLKGAKRRRLHLGNHHRAVLNNGQTTRHRSGRPRRQQQQQQQQQQPDRNDDALHALATTTGDTQHIEQHRDAPSTPSMAAAMDMVMISDGPTARHLFTDPNMTHSPTQSLPQHVPPPPPPINRMLKYFTGKLVEMTKREAYAVCSQLMGCPELVDDFSIFHGLGNADGGLGGAAGASATAWRGSPTAATASSGGDSNGARRTPPSKRSYPRTRFFLLPELVPRGYIGIIIVDVVRVLVAVQKDRASREEHNSDWELEEGRMQAGRLFRPGQGYNAQYYERDELRPL